MAFDRSTDEYFHVAISVVPLRIGSRICSSSVVIEFKIGSVATFGAFATDCRQMARDGVIVVEGKDTSLLYDRFGAERSICITHPVPAVTNQMRSNMVDLVRKVFAFLTISPGRR